MSSVPFPHPQPAPLLLTPKDEAILLQFLKYRFLTAQEITRLCYSQGSHTYVRSRCSRLAGHKDLTDTALTDNYPLYRLGFPTGRLGNQERIWCLSATGAAIIEQLGHPMPWYVKRAKLRIFSHSFWLHDLTRNRFIVALHAWARSKPNLSVESQLSYDLAKTPAVVEIPLRGKLVKVSVIPDALILITNTRTNQRLLILLEIDQNTQAQGRFKQHIAARLAYVSSSHFTTTYGSLPYRIAYATQGITDAASKARLASMCAWTMDILSALKKQEQARFLRFTTVRFSTLYQDSQMLFEAPAWYRPDEPATPVPLLTD